MLKTFFQKKAPAQMQETGGLRTETRRCARCRKKCTTHPTPTYNPTLCAMCWLKERFP